MDYSKAIVKSSASIANIAKETDLGTRIPSCPDWTVGDLVFHLASVQRFWAAAVRERNPQVSPHLDDSDVDDAELVVWARDQTDALVNALTIASGAPCWTWWGEPRTASAVARHQVQEAAVHCWDIYNALGQDFEIPTDQAADGIAEFLEVQSSTMEMPADRHFSFQAIDGADVITYGDLSLPPISLHGAASDIVLVMNKRRPLEVLRVDGDVTIVQRWLDALDLT